MIKGIPNLGKFISVAAVVEKYKVIASIARVMLRKCIENGSLRQATSHGKQFVCAPTVAIVEKTAEPGKDTKKEKAKKKEKEKWFS